MKRWTQEEIEYLEELIGFDNLPMTTLFFQKMAKKRGWAERPVRSIKWKINNLGYSVSPMYDNWTALSFAKMLDIDHSRVKEWIWGGLLKSSKQGQTLHRIKNKDFVEFANKYPDKLRNTSIDALQYLLPQKTVDKIQIRPLLKWVGGKRYLIPYLFTLTKSIKYKRLVEPFCGGLSVTLGLQPEYALLNDINPYLINFYQQVKQGLDITIDFRNDRDYYNQTRTKFNSLSLDEEPKALAQLFYYLNRTGYNGLCRFNLQGKFNVPFGRYKTLFYERNLNAYKKHFANYNFTCSDFSNLIIKNDDLIYADPPYDKSFTKYNAIDFKWEDQVRLAEWLKNQSVPVITSNQATPRILELYQDLGFKVKTILAPRQIACNGDRTPAKEMIAYK